MKSTIATNGIGGWAAGVLLLLLTVTSARAGGQALQFTATSGNITDSGSGNAIILESPILNKKPTLILVVTQNLTNGMYNDSQVGVQYDKASERWQIFNENGDKMPVGAKFNVLVSSSAFHVNANANNSESDWTYFQPEKDNDKGMFLVTHEANPLGTLSYPVYVDRNIGVWYDGPFTTKPLAPDENKWAVYYEDEGTTLPVEFNVADVTKDKNAFIVVTNTATGGNTISNYVTFDDSVTTGDSNAVVFTTHVYNPPGDAHNYLDHPIGVWYNGANWTIFTEDSAPMPNGITFVVDAFAKPTP